MDWAEHKRHMTCANLIQKHRRTPDGGGGPDGASAATILDRHGNTVSEADAEAEGLDINGDGSMAGAVGVSGGGGGGGGFAPSPSMNCPRRRTTLTRVGSSCAAIGTCFQTPWGGLPTLGPPPPAPPAAPPLASSSVGSTEPVAPARPPHSAAPRRVEESGRDAPPGTPRSSGRLRRPARPVHRPAAVHGRLAGRSPPSHPRGHRPPRAPRLVRRPSAAHRRSTDSHPPRRVLRIALPALVRRGRRRSDQSADPPPERHRRQHPDRCARRGLPRRSPPSPRHRGGRRQATISLRIPRGLHRSPPLQLARVQRNDRRLRAGRGLSHVPDGHRRRRPLAAAQEHYSEPDQPRRVGACGHHRRGDGRRRARRAVAGEGGRRPRHPRRRPRVRGGRRREAAAQRRGAQTARDRPRAQRRRARLT